MFGLTYKTKYEHREIFITITFDFFCVKNADLRPPDVEEDTDSHAIKTALFTGSIHTNRSKFTTRIKRTVSRASARAVTEP